MAIASDDKLEIYNFALYHLGSRKLSSISENREPRRVLDQIWGSSDRAVSRSLERAGWNFAMRAVQATLDESLTPEFGWSYVFEKPTDYCRLEAIGPDPTFAITLTNDYYADENNYWLCNYEELYVKYVSNDGDFGFNSAIWSEAFKEYLSAYLAFHAAERITGSTQKKDYLGGEMVRALGAAKSTDAMEEGTKFPQPGKWASARRYGQNGERGSRTRLIG